MNTWYTEKISTKIGEKIVFSVITTEDVVAATLDNNNDHVEQLIIPEPKRVILKEEYYLDKETIYTLYTEAHIFRTKYVLFFTIYLIPGL